MIVLDTSGWIEYFTDGPLADDYEPHIINPSEILTPTIVVYEFYKKVKRERGICEANLGLSKMAKTTIVYLDESLALADADVSNTYKTAMADSIIYAVARSHGAQLVTSDSDLKDLPDVLYLPKPPKP
jgi:toxin FitB